ncbi:DUF1456 family protein [Oligoflexaceae bacterium]|nr:DUF1456 family protein [Oligoflexaceae bacterium]
MMNHNDILRRSRFIFNLRDAEMQSIFALVNHQISTAHLRALLQADEDPEFVLCKDRELALFLNGLIIKNRGARDESPVKIEQRISNNIILRKFKIALDMKTEDVLSTLELADFKMGASELTAFFRKADHKNYRKCKDQILRKFMIGLQLKYRPDSLADKEGNV